jgi:DNA-binding CsgD family transcriptional regulator/tetratricopeptide (TPR) repeat protein
MRVACAFHAALTSVICGGVRDNRVEAFMSEGMQSPLFVGRREEVATLVGLLLRAGEGEPGFAVVAGEAGIGKTRLVSELAGHAAGAGFTVLIGHCAELGAEGLPLAPLTDALRTLARTMAPGDLADVLGPARRGLGRLLPELDPDAAGAGGLVAGASAEAAADGIRLGQLLELLLAVLARISVRQPLMLVIEDLHWADQATRELVAFLVRSLRGIGVLLLVTYRSDELTRRHPLRQLIASWERLRTVTRVELHRFDRAEVAAQLGGIFAAEPAGDVVDLVLDRSGGNAYLVEELAGLVRGGGGPADLPAPLRDVLLSRVDSLSEGAQRLVRSAAVAGRGVSDGLLAEVSGVGGTEFYARLREAVDSHLLVVDHTGRGYAFRHALTRDAVYEDLLPGERVALHVAYGEALSREPALAGDDAAVPAALAHHWYAALDLPRALPASIAAARHALTSFAAAEAQRHLERALEMWPRVPDAEQRAGMDQAEVASLAGDAAYQAGNIDRSLSLLDQALAGLPAAPDPVRRALVLDRRARTLRDSGHEADAIKTLEQALALLPADQVTTVHAIVLSSLATAVMRTDDMVPAAALAARAVQAARETGAAQQEADSSVTLGLARSYLSAGAEGLDELRAGLALAMEIGAPATAVRGYVNLSDALEFLGRHDEAAQVAREGIALAGRVGLARTLGAFLTGNLVESLIRLGRWDEADRLAAQALNAMPEGVFAIGVLTCRAELAVMRGRYQEADADLRAARLWVSHSTGEQYSLPVRYTGALIAVGQGELGMARLATEKLADSPPMSMRYLWPLLWMAARVEADEAILARDRLEEIPASSSARWHELAGLAEGLAGRTPPAWRGYRALVSAELARAEGKHDVAAWSAAADVWRAAGEPYPLAYSLLRLAEAAAVTGDRQCASVSVSQAHALASEVGAAPLADEAATLARRARLRLAEPAEPADVAPPIEPLARFGLTGRELAVLRLLAAGRTNAQIGAELFISPRTAGVHVTNILRKLGVTGRVQAAAVAERAGLLQARRP